ncbi:MAG: hypothetical protein M1814_003764 [Vezdaea aestivalis]|nr:MAG: hypothetical protein M1814_003764 [Vezdaea aestivalis]
MAHTFAFLWLTTSLAILLVGIYVSTDTASLAVYKSSTAIASNKRATLPHPRSARIRWAYGRDDVDD